MELGQEQSWSEHIQTHSEDLTCVTAMVAFSTVFLKTPVSSRSCLAVWRVGGRPAHTQCSSSSRQEQCTSESSWNRLGRITMMTAVNILITLLYQCVIETSPQLLYSKI